MYFDPWGARNWTNKQKVQASNKKYKLSNLVDEDNVDSSFKKKKNLREKNDFDSWDAWNLKGKKKKEIEGK